MRIREKDFKKLFNEKTNINMLVVASCFFNISTAAYKGVSYIEQS